MLIDLKVSPLAPKCVLLESGGAHGTEIKFLKFKTETYQRIELKEYMTKMRSFV